MNNNFVEKLKWLRSEVLALKQAHEYGIGRADFPWEGQEIYVGQNVSGTLTVKVVFGDNVENMPYLQFYTKIGNWDWFIGNNGSWANHTYTIQSTFNDWTQVAPDTFYVVATMPIKDIEVEVDYV